MVKHTAHDSDYEGSSPSGPYADMMKMVDISDLGSDELCSWGFKSLYPYSGV